jgi:hypothetical protein
MYIGCLLSDVALCMHVCSAFPQVAPNLSFHIDAGGSRLTMVLSRYAHTSACSTRIMQAAVVSRSPQAAVVVGWGGYFHANLGVLLAVRVCTEAL